MILHIKLLEECFTTWPITHHISGVRPVLPLVKFYSNQLQLHIYSCNTIYSHLLTTHQDIYVAIMYSDIRIISIVALGDFLNIMCILRCILPTYSELCLHTIIFSIQAIQLCTYISSQLCLKILGSLSKHFKPPLTSCASAIMYDKLSSQLHICSYLMKTCTCVCVNIHTHIYTHTKYIQPP